jgi:hypothetical protein
VLCSVHKDARSCARVQVTSATDVDGAGWERTLLDLSSNFPPDSPHSCMSGVTGTSLRGVYNPATDGIHAGR